MAIMCHVKVARRLCIYLRAVIDLLDQQLNPSVQLEQPDPSAEKLPDVEKASYLAPRASEERTMAWKHVGYPGFSKLMSSSDDLLALRRFKEANVRVLLRLQDEIVRLERELTREDNYTRSLPGQRGSCASLRLDAGSPREKTLTQLQHHLKDYNERLNTYLQLCDRPGAPVTVTGNLKKWLLLYPNAIEGPEQEFLNHQEDLIVGNVKRQSMAGRWLFERGAWKAAITTATPTPSDAPGSAGTVYYDGATWRRFGDVFSVGTTVVTLLGFVWSFHAAESLQSHLVALSFSTVGFTILVETTTTLEAMQKCYAVAWFIMFETLTIGTITKGNLH